MESTQETGHSKNVANLKNLIAFLAGNRVTSKQYDKSLE
jgi:hypothetical protein